MKAFTVGSSCVGVCLSLRSPPLHRRGLELEVLGELGEQNAYPCNYHSAAAQHHCADNGYHQEQGAALNLPRYIVVNLSITFSIFPPCVHQIPRVSCLLFDPLFTEWEKSFLKDCGMVVITENEASGTKISISLKPDKNENLV